MSTTRASMLLAWLVALTGVLAWLVGYEAWRILLVLMVMHAMGR